MNEIAYDIKGNPITLHEEMKIYDSIAGNCMDLTSLELVEFFLKLEQEFNINIDIDTMYIKDIINKIEVAPVRCK